MGEGMMGLNGLQPRFGSRYAYEVDINKTNINPLQADICDKVTFPSLHHWSKTPRIVDVNIVTGLKGTLPAKGNVFYVESGHLHDNKVAQFVSQLLPKFITEKIEAYADKQVEAVFKKHNIPYTKENYEKLFQN
jgi:hypothetical protein